MGLYDYINCQYKLPIPENRGELTEKDFYRIFNFQTKSLGKEMRNYEIREDGSVFVESFDLEFRKYSEEEIGRWDEIDGLFQIEGEYKKINKKWIPYHTGDSIITFYDLYCPLENDGFGIKEQYWVEYEMSFKDSKVESVKLVKFEQRNSAEAENRLREVLKHIEKDHSRIRTFIRSIFKFWRFHTKWIPTSHELEKWILKN